MWWWINGHDNVDKYGLRYETKNAKISDCNENLSTGISYKHEIKGSYYKYKHKFFHIFIFICKLHKTCEVL